VASGRLHSGCESPGAVDISKLPPPSAEKNVTFEKHIKPVLDKHVSNATGKKKQKAKLRLDSLEAALKGAGKTKVIQPGQERKSLMVHAVARLVEDDAMPPKGKGDPLTQEQVA